MAREYVSPEQYYGKEAWETIKFFRAIDERIRKENQKREEEKKKIQLMEELNKKFRQQQEEQEEQLIQEFNKKFKAEREAKND